MTSAVYVRYEVVRTLRNVRFLVFSVGFPLVLYVLIAGPNRHAAMGGIGLPLYLMTGMVSWGAMSALLASGGRIAFDRSIGWSRQLRVTPLRPVSYVGSKILTGYLLAAITVTLLFVTGAVFGVRMPAGHWLLLAALVLIGLVPFAALGIALGHLLSVDSFGPALGGITTLLALLGGSWGPIATGGVWLAIVRFLPSYWLVRAGAVALDGHVWPIEGWLVVGGWSLVLTRLAFYAYRRDTART